VTSIALHSRALQVGDELCRIEGFDRRKAVSELKIRIEAETYPVIFNRVIGQHSGTRFSFLTRLSADHQSLVELQDHQTLEDVGLLSEQDLTAGVIQLYVFAPLSWIRALNTMRVDPNGLQFAAYNKLGNGI
jgi:hypothetical protein